MFYFLMPMNDNTSKDRLRAICKLPMTLLLVKIYHESFYIINFCCLQAFSEAWATRLKNLP